MGQKMGFDFGLEKCPGKIRKFRWMLVLDGVCGSKSKSGGIPALPPSKAARPSVSLREMEARHLVETIYYPSRPEWKPLQVVLYDLSGGKHPVMEWLKELYDGETAKWKFPATDKFCKQASLDMLDGCGEIIQSWIYEEVWPLTADFGDLDMGSSEVATCDLTLRYARAYIKGNG
jgi:hypothetical protein